MKKIIYFLMFIILSSFVFAVSNSSTIDLLFSNITDTFTYKNVFNVEENFKIWGNWSDDDDNRILNMTFGECNLTMLNMSFLGLPVTNDKSICNAGCDFDTLIGGNTFTSTDNVFDDTLRVMACHNQVILEPLTLNISCNNGGTSLTQEFSTAALIDCDDGFTDIFLKYDGCIAANDINFTITNDANIFIFGHTITDTYIDRRYTTITETGFFNDSRNLWQVNRSFHEHEDINRSVNLNCTPSVGFDINFNNSISENLFITNIPPIIIFEIVNNSGGIFNISNGVVLEYFSGIWNWLFTIEDLNPDWHNVTFLNSSGDILVSVTERTINFHDTPDMLFIDFINGNPYNLTIWANDTNKNVTQASILFNVTEAVTPPLYNNTIIDKTNWFNTDILDVNTVAGVFLYIFLLLIIIGFIILSERLQIPALAIISGLAIFFYGILIYTKITAILGLFVTIIGCMYLIRSVLMYKS